MTKLKSHSGAKKRFKLTASKKVRVKRGSGRHLLTKKSRDNKRKKKSMITLEKGDSANIKKMLAC